MNSIDKLRRYPKTEEEGTWQLEPLIPREILEPLYHEYIRLHPPYDKTENEISGFYKFLLNQSKPE